MLASEECVSSDLTQMVSSLSKGSEGRDGNPLFNVWEPSVVQSLRLSVGELLVRELANASFLVLPGIMQVSLVGVFAFSRMDLLCFGLVG